MKKVKKTKKIDIPDNVKKQGLVVNTKLSGRLFTRVPTKEEIKGYRIAWQIQSAEED